jgi:hypothetical protein
MDFQLEVASMSKTPTKVLAHSDGPVIPLGGCVIYWTASALKSVLAHAEAQTAQDREEGVKPAGGCIVYWWAA